MYQLRRSSSRSSSRCSRHQTDHQQRLPGSCLPRVHRSKQPSIDLGRAPQVVVRVTEAVGFGMYSTPRRVTHFWSLDTHYYTINTLYFILCFGHVTLDIYGRNSLLSSIVTSTFQGSPRKFELCLLNKATWRGTYMSSSIVMIAKYWSDAKNSFAGAYIHLFDTYVRTVPMEVKDISGKIRRLYKCV